MEACERSALGRNSNHNQRSDRPRKTPGQPLLTTYVLQDNPQRQRNQSAAGDAPDYEP